MGSAMYRLWVTPKYWCNCLFPNTHFSWKKSVICLCFVLTGSPDEQKNLLTFLKNLLTWFEWLQTDYWFMMMWADGYRSNVVSVSAKDTLGHKLLQCSVSWFIYVMLVSGTSAINQPLCYQSINHFIAIYMLTHIIAIAVVLHALNTFKNQH